MRSVHVFNPVNDAYNIVKYMRAAGMQADLILYEQDFGMAFPQWENGKLPLGADPYALDARDLDDLSLPSWVKVWDEKRYGNDVLARAANRIDLYRLIRGYDVLQAYALSPVYAQFLHTPYVVYDAGWVRNFPFLDTVTDKFARRGYMKAKAVLVTNPDTFEIFDRLPYIKRTLFIPFVIDLDTYRPSRSSIRHQFDCDFLVFSPTRHHWREKGNDKILIGFARFLEKSRIRSLLLMVEWGPDWERSKALIRDLGIAKFVRTMRPVNKIDLVEYYNAADVIVDQFVVGSYGTLAPEAMSCEKPVIMYYSVLAFTRAFGELPPLLNAFTAEEISGQLMRCSESDFRNRVGRMSREWITKHHNWRSVVDRERMVFSFAVGECEWQEVTGS